MENGHLIVGKFSHTIEEIDIAVDKTLQDGQIKEVKKPVIFGRCIPMNAQCGSRYYYNDKIKIKTNDVIKLDLDLYPTEWIRVGLDWYYYMRVEYPTIVTIPKDFDYRRFVLDSEYRDSLYEYTDGNIENTAAPYWKIINGTPVFTKVASPHDEHVRLFSFRRKYRRRSWHDTSFSKFKAAKEITQGCYCIAFATTHRKRRRAYVERNGGWGEQLKKCSIVSAKWYCKPTKTQLLAPIQIQ